MTRDVVDEETFVWKFATPTFGRTWSYVGAAPERRPWVGPFISSSSFDSFESDVPHPCCLVGADALAVTVTRKALQRAQSSGSLPSIYNVATKHLPAPPARLRPYFTPSGAETTESCIFVV